MPRAGFSLEEHPPTRHLRYKRILVVDPEDQWSRPIRDALEDCGFYVYAASGPREGARRFSDRAADLLVVSTFGGDRALRHVLEELQALSEPPPVLVVAALNGEMRWEAWQALPRVTRIRQPFTIDDIVQAARSVLGNCWVDDEREI